MSEPQLTGMAKTFNSVTFTGRANVAKATYAGKFKEQNTKLQHSRRWWGSTEKPIF